MELRHLRYFVAVAETQNVTKAAARLNVSQPPLSRQIRDLEDELNVSLFERGAKSMRLTDAGRVFYIEAKAVLDRMSEAIHAVQAVAGGNGGDLHIGYAPSLTVEILPRALRRFQESTPEVKVVLHDLSSGEMLTNLEERKLNLAFMVDSIVPTRRMLFTELRRYAVCVAVAPAHPLAGEKDIRLSQVASERIIAYSRTDYPEYFSWLTRLLSKTKARPQIAEEYDSVTSLIAAVEAGRGIAIVSKSLACLAGPRLVVKDLRPAQPMMTIGIVHRREKLTPPEAAFLAAAKASAE
jgi:DNA-binding transcriptional LysR family regulator